MRARDDGDSFSTQFQSRPGVNSGCCGLLLLLLVASDGYLAMICIVGLDLAGFGFWISIWCYNCGFRGSVWCLNGVLDVMVVVVVLLFGVFGWLVQ